MRPSRTIRLFTASAALAGIVAFEFMAGPFFVPEAPQEAPAIDGLADTPIASPGERPDISTFAEVTARPLFSPSRRPYEPSSEPKAGGVAKTETFDLIGVTISPHERSALLRPKVSSEVLRVVEGQSVGGWEVRAIEPTQITLGRGNGGKDSTVLTINEKRKKFAGSTQARPQKQSTVKQASPEQPQQDSAPTETTEEPAPQE